MCCFSVPTFAIRLECGTSLNHVVLQSDIYCKSFKWRKTESKKVILSVRLEVIVGFKEDGCLFSRDQPDVMSVKGELNGVKLARKVGDCTWKIN